MKCLTYCQCPRHQSKAVALNAPSVELLEQLTFLLLQLLDWVVASWMPALWALGGHGVGGGPSKKERALSYGTYKRSVLIRMFLRPLAFCDRFLCSAFNLSYLLREIPVVACAQRFWVLHRMHTSRYISCVPTCKVRSMYWQLRFGDTRLTCYYGNDDVQAWHFGNVWACQLVYDETCSH